MQQISNHTVTQSNKPNDRNALTLIQLNNKLTIIMKNDDEERRAMKHKNI